MQKHTNFEKISYICKKLWNKVDDIDFVVRTKISHYTNFSKKDGLKNRLFYCNQELGMINKELEQIKSYL